MSKVFNSKTNYEVDLSKPPLGPPGREIRWFFGEFETKKSKKERKLWEEYLKRYSLELHKLYPRDVRLTKSAHSLTDIHW